MEGDFPPVLTIATHALIFSIFFRPLNFMTLMHPLTNSCLGI